MERSHLIKWRQNTLDELIKPKSRSSLLYYQLSWIDWFSLIWHYKDPKQSWASSILLCYEWQLNHRHQGHHLVYNTMHSLPFPVMTGRRNVKTFGGQYIKAGSGVIFWIVQNRPTNKVVYTKISKTKFSMYFWEKIKGYLLLCILNI